MKQRSTHHGGVKLRVQVFVLAVALAVVVALPSGCTSGRVGSASTERPQTPSHDTTSPKEHREAQLPECPFLGSPGLVTSQVKGGHAVILSWTASVSDSKHADAVGYCIYRSTGHKNASLERVNSIPLQVTTCSDDVVENGKNYYYVVRAISAKRILSDSSKVAPARIPTRESSNPVKISAPFCRGPAGSM